MDKKIDKKCWYICWRKFRGEIFIWIFSLVFYMLFMKDSEVSKYAQGMLIVVVFFPPVILVRFFVTFRRCGAQISSVDPLGEDDGR